MNIFPRRYCMNIFVRFIVAVSIIILTWPTALLAAETTYNQIVTQDDYEIVTDKESGYNAINMLTSGYRLIQSPGDPALPEKILEFSVPQDVNPATIEVFVEIEQQDVLGGYNIQPTPPLGPVAAASELPYDPDYEDWGLEKNIVQGKNMDVYGQDADYPEKQVVLMGCVQKKEPFVIELLSSQNQDAFVPGQSFTLHKYVSVAYRPFLYNPATMELTVITDATITLRYEQDIILKDVQTKSNGGTYDYVIVTTNDIVANSNRLDNFVYLKELMGHTVKIVTEDDFGSLTGQAPNGRAEKIRQWLINNYASMGINHVLLIGDPDPDDPSNATDSVGDIPMKMCWPRYFSWNYRESPTDYFYADLTGNWDLDGDGYFGEGLDVLHGTSPDPSIDPDTFSVRWTGQVECDFTEEYEFHLFSDEGVRLYINGTKVIDNWSDHLPTNDYHTQNMTAGKYDITLEFKDTTDEAIVQLWWKTTVGKEDPNYVRHQIIPSDHLFNDAGTQGGLTGTYYNNVDFTDLKMTRTDAVVNFIWGTGDTGVGGPETGAEVFVGRIPVYGNDYAQLDTILDKIISYQTDSNDLSWRKSMLLPMKPLWDDTPSYHLGEGIRDDIATGAGFSTYRIYEEDYSSSGGPTPDDWPCTMDTVENEWLNGYGMVVWATHGSSTGASHIFDSTRASNLDDSVPSFTFQASCLTGYPENANNLSYALLKNGAIATVSASRVSWEAHGAWTFDPLSGLNHNLAYYYAQKLISGSPAKTAGQALYLTKGDIPDVGMNEMDYNLYGDPGIFFLSTLPNNAPVADAGSPYTADEGTAVTFNASGSSDPDGDPLQYRWDFNNDGTWDTTWSDDPTATYTWCDDYSGPVLVMVRDQLGLTDEASASVSVTNVSPVAEAGEDQNADEGAQVSFIGSSTDPGCDTWTYEWTFGDGSPAVTGTLSPDHIYGDNGVYTVTLTVTDDDGGIGTDTCTVTVSNINPTVEGLALSQPNQQFILPLVHTLTFTGGFSDPGWLDTHTSQWDFGDGSSTVPGTLTEENNAPDATGESEGQHVYVATGTYTVTLEVCDDDGGCGNNTIQVTVVGAEEAVMDINAYIQSLPDSAFKKPAGQRKSALANKLAAVGSMLAGGNYQGALHQLGMDIRPKADGFEGNPQGDWIVDPDAQAEICLKIDDVMDYLKQLMTL